MNAQKNTDWGVKVHLVDTNAPGKDTRSSGTDTFGYVKTLETLYDNSKFSERIDDTAHMQEDHVTMGTNGEISGNKGTKNNPKRAVILWGDCEYDVEEFRTLLMEKTGDTMEMEI